MEDYLLNEAETRVLGVLMEKQMTTPEYYPMTVNGTKTACNQKSNRHPVVQYDEDFVSDIISELRRKKMIIMMSGRGMRSRKYEHNLKDLLFLSRKEMAVLCVLMLRGPQTVGELRGRSERMVDFNGLSEVEETLNDLSAEGRQPLTLVKKLPVLPGQKENRYIHLLCGEPNMEQLTAELIYDAPTPSVRTTSATRITELEETVTQLQKEVEALKAAFHAFKKEFE